MEKERLQSIRQCSSRASTITTALELCGTSDELVATLEDMGFHMYEYVADTIYKDGDRQHVLAGMVHMFTQWHRCDEALGLNDTVDVDAGTVRVRSMNHAHVDAVQVLSRVTTRLLRQ